MNEAWVEHNLWLICTSSLNKKYWFKMKLFFFSLIVVLYIFLWRHWIGRLQMKTWLTWIYFWIWKDGINKYVVRVRPVFSDRTSKLIRFTVIILHIYITWEKQKRQGIHKCTPDACSDCKTKDFPVSLIKNIYTILVMLYTLTVA